MANWNSHGRNEAEAAVAAGVGRHQRKTQISLSFSISAWVGNRACKKLDAESAVGDAVERALNCRVGTSIHRCRKHREILHAIRTGIRVVEVVHGNATTIDVDSQSTVGMDRVALDQIAKPLVGQNIRQWQQHATATVESDGVSFAGLGSADQIVGAVHPNAVAIHDAARCPVPKWGNPVSRDADQVALDRVECPAGRDQDAVAEVARNDIGSSGRVAPNQGVGDVAVDVDARAIGNRRRAGGIGADPVPLDGVVRTEHLDAIAIGIVRDDIAGAWRGSAYQIVHAAIEADRRAGNTGHASSSCPSLVRAEVIALNLVADIGATGIRNINCGSAGGEDVSCLRRGSSDEIIVGGNRIGVNEDSIQVVRKRPRPTGIQTERIALHNIAGR